MLGLLFTTLFPPSKSSFDRGYEYCAQRLELDSSPKNIENLWIMSHPEQYGFGEFEKGMKQALYDADLKSKCQYNPSPATNGRAHREI